MWDLPQPRIRAVSLALHGGFLTTGRKWKRGSPCFHFLDSVLWNTNNFNFDEVRFTSFLLLLLVLLLSYLRRSCLIQGHKSLLLCFLLRVIVPYSVTWGYNFTLLPLDIYSSHSTTNAANKIIQGTRVALCLIWPVWSVFVDIWVLQTASQRGDYLSLIHNIRGGVSKQMELCEKLCWERGGCERWSLFTSVTLGLTCQLA